MLLCLHCAFIFEDATICPQCNTYVDRSKYDTLIKRVSDYVLFGYEYRRTYEKQLNEHGKINTKFCLIEPTEAMKWIGLAIVSGVVGNASYDLIKIVCKKIVDQMKPDKAVKLIKIEECYEEINKYLIEYHCNFKDVRPEIREAIMEELMAYESEKVDIDILISGPTDDGKSAPIRLLKVASVAARKRYKMKISSGLVNNIWDKL